MNANCDDLAIRRQESTKRNTDSQIQDGTRRETVLKAIDRRKILDVTIASTLRIYTLGDDYIWAMTLMDTENGRMQVFVPFSEMFPYSFDAIESVDVKEANAKAKIKSAQERILSRYLGANIAVCLTAIIKNPKNPEEDMICASRVAAMKQLRDGTFLRAKDPVKNGDLCRGRILCVGPTYVSMTFNGVDTVIPRSRLSYRFMPDLMDYYRVNDVIEFVMTELEAKESSIKFIPDSKSAEEINYRKTLENGSGIYPGTRTRAFVVTVKEARGRRGLTARVWLPDYEVPGYITEINPDTLGREIKSGDEILIKIDDVFRDKGYVSAFYESRIRSSGTYYLNHGRY